MADERVSLAARKYEGAPSEAMLKNALKLLDSIAERGEHKGSHHDGKRTEKRFGGSLKTVAHSLLGPDGADTSACADHGRAWHMRTTTFSCESDDDARALLTIFERGLKGSNHARNEPDYISTCIGSELVEELAPNAQVWRTMYKMPGPLTSREFFTLISSHEHEHGFVVLQLPVPREQTHGFVLGVYVAVESFLRTPGTNDVVWRMATATDPRGNIPKLFVEKSMPGTVCEDVPSFFNWALEKELDKA